MPPKDKAHTTMNLPIFSASERLFFVNQPLAAKIKQIALGIDSQIISAVPRWLKNTSRRVAATASAPFRDFLSILGIVANNATCAKYIMTALS